MKFLTWILILCFTSQAMASTVREGLEAAMNEFEYELVVEWDQKDAAKAEAFTQKFSQKLEDLYKQGLSTDTLMKYVESRVPDKQKLAAIRASAALTAKDGSSKALALTLKENMENFGKQGANWNGQALLTGGIIVGLLAIAALIVKQIIWESTHRCNIGETYESCGYVTHCDGWSTDEYGEEYCSSTYESYECNDEERCVQWMKYK